MTDGADEGPTHRPSFRYGVASGLWAAAAIAERHGRKDIADEIRAYERKTTNVRFYDEPPKMAQMTERDLGYGEMQPEDLGMTSWPNIGGVIREELRDPRPGDSDK